MNTTTGVTNSSGVITLQPGTYQLNGSIGTIGSSSGSIKVLSGFWNISTGAWVGQGGQTASGNASNYNAQAYNNANVVLTVTTTTQIALRLNAQTGNVTINSAGDFSQTSLAESWVTVQQY